MRTKLRPQRGGPLLVPCLISQTARSQPDAGVGMEMDSRTKLDVGEERLELPNLLLEWAKRRFTFSGVSSKMSLAGS